jgi:hypothetical protein
MTDWKVELTSWRANCWLSWAEERREDAWELYVWAVMKRELVYESTFFEYRKAELAESNSNWADLVFISAWKYATFLS